MTLLDRIRQWHRPNVTPESELLEADDRSRKLAVEATNLAEISRRERERNHFADRIRTELQGRHP